MQVVDASVGSRLAQARAERGLTQVQLASAVGLHRTAVAKIENGDRRVSAVELDAMARELGRRIDWFITPGPDTIASYRMSAQSLVPQGVDMDLDRIARDIEFVAAEVPFLPGALPEPQPRPVSNGDAEALAVKVRPMLGIAQNEPANDLDRRVADLGLLVFSLPIPDGADGATVLLAQGGVSVINGALQVGRRRLTLAHELGHYLVQDPYTTDWRVGTSAADALEARLDRFARAVLLPETDLRARWVDWLARDGLRDAAVFAGSHYRVDMATLSRRLVELGISSEHEAAQVRQVRTKKADIVEKDLLVPHEMDPVALPAVYQRAVLNLYRREIISADRALDLLLGTFDEDALPDLPPVSEGEIWAVTS